MTTVRYTIKALDLSTWDAFAALVEANGGIFGGCWCMGFHPDDRTHLDAPEPHRAQKFGRVRARTAHTALVFDGDECVGWCQFGAPEEVPRIKNRKEYDKGLVELPDWRIACCYVGEGHRCEALQPLRSPAHWNSSPASVVAPSRATPNLPATCRRGPLPRCAVNLRTGRVPPGPQDRQAPMGRLHPRGSGRAVTASRRRRSERRPAQRAAPAKRTAFLSPGNRRLPPARQRHELATSVPRPDSC